MVPLSFPDGRVPRRAVRRGMVERRHNVCHTVTMTDPTAARKALERGNWLDALTAVGELDEVRDDPAALEVRAQAAYGAGEFEAAVEAWEQLFQLERGRGDPVAAARAAAMVGMYLMMD